MTLAHNYITPDDQADAVIEASFRELDRANAAAAKKEAEEKAALKDLRKRAVALGFGTIEKRLGKYRLIHTNGDCGMGTPCTDSMSYLLATFERYDARNRPGAT